MSTFSRSLRSSAGPKVANAAASGSSVSTTKKTTSLRLKLTRDQPCRDG
jgi:hypothetical protein